VVLEAGVPLRHDEAALIRSLEGRRSVVIRNKSDLVLSAPDPVMDQDAPGIFTSALTGEGIGQLRDALLEIVRSPSSESESGMLTSLRHHEAVTAALTSLASARAAIRAKVPHEMLLLDLYASLRQLDSLTGETTADDILNRIFSTFCIGK
ncbi:MAG TPA: hypothetical protein VK670_03075, partial [Silvibacterium sp.]|nr:hypothetical protein [Silvibacterium sp.]